MRILRRAILTGLTSICVLAGLSGSAFADEQLLNAWGSFNEDPLPGRFNEIVDLETDPRGYVYVLDELLSGAGRVQKFTSTGQLVRQFGVPADEDDRWDTDEIVGALHDPSGITVGPDRNVYVAESGSRTRISVWSPLGKYIRSFGSGGIGDGQLSSPRGMMFDDSGNLGVADSGNSRIAVFGPGGNWVNAVAGFDAISYSGPDDIAALGDSIYVAVGDVVARFSASGSATLIGGEGPNGEPAPFSQATSVTAGGDRIYVADQSQSTVQAFTPAGALLNRVGPGPGSQPGQMVRPNALATDCKGTLYVADAGNSRIQRFGSPGAAPCGQISADKEEKLVIRLIGKKAQRFREAFAVQATVSCDRPCRGTLKGWIKIRGKRKVVRLTPEPLTREFPGPAVTNVAPTERGTDTVIAALERRRRAKAHIKLVARDLAGRKVIRKRTYRLR